MSETIPAGSSRHFTPLQPCQAGFLQFSPVPADIDTNLHLVESGLSRLLPEQPAIIVLPELWATDFVYDRLPDLARRTPEILGALSEMASRHGAGGGKEKRPLYLAGSLPEAVQSAEGLKIYNTLFVSGPEGTVGSYRKQQLFLPTGEAQTFTPGDNPQPLATPLGELAALICFDLRFPELGRAQAAKGAGLLLLSAQWPASRLQHWRILLRARAIENQMFVAAANRSGACNGLLFAGHSMLVAPDGEILLEAGEEAGEGLRQLDPERLRQFRGLFNSVAPGPCRFAAQDKVVSPEELSERVRGYRYAGQRLVFIEMKGNGQAPGLKQLERLEAARRRGDCLIVGLSHAGAAPAASHKKQARLLAGLGCVDHVVILPAGSRERLLRALAPEEVFG